MKNKRYLTPEQRPAHEITSVLVYSRCSKNAGSLSRAARVTWYHALNSGLLGVLREEVLKLSVREFLQLSTSVPRSNSLSDVSAAAGLEGTADPNARFPAVGTIPTSQTGSGLPQESALDARGADTAGLLARTMQTLTADASRSAALPDGYLHPLQFVTTREVSTGGMQARKPPPAVPAVTPAAQGSLQQAVVPRRPAEGTRELDLGSDGGGTETSAGISTSGRAWRRSEAGIPQQPVSGDRSMSLGDAMEGLDSADREAVNAATRASAEGSDGGVGHLSAKASYSSSQSCAGKSFGAFPDDSNPRCWDMCLGFKSFGAHVCCQPGECFQPPTSSCPLGLCGDCSNVYVAPPPSPQRLTHNL